MPKKRDCDGLDRLMGSFSHGRSNPSHPRHGPSTGRNGGPVPRSGRSPVFGPDGVIRTGPIWPIMLLTTWGDRRNPRRHTRAPRPSSQGEDHSIGPAACSFTRMATLPDGGRRDARAIPPSLDPPSPEAHESPERRPPRAGVASAGRAPHSNDDKGDTNSNPFSGGTRLTPFRNNRTGTTEGRRSAGSTVLFHPSSTVFRRAFEIVSARREIRARGHSPPFARTVHATP